MTLGTCGLRKLSRDSKSRKRPVSLLCASHSHAGVATPLVRVVVGSAFGGCGASGTNVKLGVVLTGGTDVGVVACASGTGTKVTLHHAFGGK